MIKILNDGYPRACHCPVCDCFFTYEKSDILFIQTDVNEHQRFVYCPDCGERILRRENRDRGEV